MEVQRELFDAGKRGAIPAKTCTPYRPGTGPAGETCGTCGNLTRRRWAGTYLKCGLMRRCWTNGAATDVRARWPACKAWKPEGGGDDT